MSDYYKRCRTCIHQDCPEDCKKCCMLKDVNEIPSKRSGCGCIAYKFDANGNCPFYEEDKE